MKILGIDALSIIKYFCLTMVVILALQTYSIQVINSDAYQQKTKDDVTRTKNIYAERGLIMDRNGVVFADNLRDSTNNTEFTRIFLQGTLASQIVGKVNYSGEGSMGVERVFDTTLRGNEGFRLSYQDARSNEIYGRSEKIADAEPGKNLVLTIDKNMQEIVEKELKQGVEEFKAASASAVVLDPYTGEILAMATYPTYDPNSKKQVVGRVTKNDIVSMSYEPGSTFKVITAAAALESGAVDTNRVFHDEGRCWTWNPKASPICDTHVYGDMNMPEAMVQSSNVVFAKIAAEVGSKDMYIMANHFGFGQKTSDQFYGEESGLLKDHIALASNSGSDLRTMGFGHAVSVTPIQMAMAYGAVANGGFLMKPMLVKEWRDANGDVVKKMEPDTVRRVISEKTAASIRSMLNRVVNSGTARQVASKKIPDVIFGGKTGTAEKYNQEKGKYDRNSQVASFIGLAPAEDTRYVCLVMVDDPQSKHVGGLTAGPIFRRIMEDIYFHPELSPKSYHIAVSGESNPCGDDYIGRDMEEAKELASSKNCKIRFQGAEEGRVVSVRRDMGDSLGLTLLLGSVNGNRMPNFKGMSLKDAMEMASNIRMKVEYSGKGRVVAQYPKADEVLTKGQVCKLTLKERS